MNDEIFRFWVKFSDGSVVGGLEIGPFQKVCKDVPGVRIILTWGVIHCYGESNEKA